MRFLPSYLLIKNAMLCRASVVLGAIAAWAFNVWLGGCYGVPAMPEWLIAASAIAVLALGQVSASFPSTRAMGRDDAWRPVKPPPLGDRGLQRLEPVAIW